MRERFQARARAAALSAAALFALGACSPDTEAPPGTGPDPEFPPVSGTWAYAAPEVRLAGSGGEAPCRITGVVLTINQFRYRGALVGDFDGRTTGGSLACNGDLSSLSGALQAFPVGQGYALNRDIAFNIGTLDWRHAGLVAGDSMSGTFVLKQGALRFEGKFVAKRTAR
jgi:hypothetical protein